jgi:hypothetical protein
MQLEATKRGKGLELLRVTLTGAQAYPLPLGTFLYVLHIFLKREDVLKVLNTALLNKLKGKHPLMGFFAVLHGQGPQLLSSKQLNNKPD